MTINPLDADKWRAEIAKLDTLVDDFRAALSRLRTPARDAALEKRRAELLAKARPIEASINALYASLRAVRDTLAKIGVTLPGLGFFPVPIAAGVTLGAIAIVAASVTSWLVLVRRYEVDAAVKAGASGVEILSGGTKEQPKIFGLESGAVPWVFGIAAMIVAGPYVFRMLQRRGIL